VREQPVVGQHLPTCHLSVLADADFARMLLSRLRNVTAVQAWLAARRQATGGLKGRGSALICVKPALRSRSSISSAALPEVSAGAPWQAWELG
jgi:hypothetical protein